MMKTINNKYIVISILIALCNFTIFSIKDAQELGKKINDIVERHLPVLIGIEVHSLRTDTVLYSFNANQLLAPASNAKLFTGVHALATLGNDFQFITQVCCDQNIVDGKLVGNLLLNAVGDPSFTSLDLENLVQRLSQTGLKEIKGDILIFNQIFDQESFAPGTTLDDLGMSYFNPIASLIIDHKAAMITPSNIVNFTDNKKLENIFFDINSVLRFLLIKYDIKFSGFISYTQEFPQANYCLAEHRSPTLLSLVSHLLKNSDNLYADCLFKKIAICKNLVTATWKNSKESLDQFLKDNLDIKPWQIKIVDGSGLSRYNLVSAHQITRLLRWAYYQPLFQDFIGTLAIAGVDGTLKNRMTDIASLIKAKTGTMGGISSLSGYIQTPDDILAFSIIINGYISTSMYNPSYKTEIEDAICRLLVEC